MENQNNNKVVIALLIVIIVILSALCILFATGTIDFNSNRENDNTANEDIDANDQSKGENNDVMESDGENDINAQENEKYKTIKLSKENESFDYDDLHLEFNGVPTGAGDGYFNYVLNVKYAGKNINSSFFNDKENYRIWSSNYGAAFEVSKLDNYYILNSWIAVQNGGHYILVMDKEANVLKTFENVRMRIIDDSLSIEISDCSSIDNPLQLCPTQIYKLSELKK